jgi:hypothetical protein
VVLALLLVLSSGIVLPVVRLFRVPPRRRLCVAAVAVIALALWYAIPVLVEAVYHVL